MKTETIVYGAVMTALGVGGFVATGAQHKSALIPAGIGVVAVGLGFASTHPLYGRAARIGALALAGVAVAASAGAIKDLPAVVQGDPTVARPQAVVAKSAMAVVSLGYAALAAHKLFRG